MKSDLVGCCGIYCAVCGRFMDGNCAGCLSKTYQCRIKSEIKGKRFAFESKPYPGDRLVRLDGTYRLRYGTSLVENLEFIRAHGLKKFLAVEVKKRRCPGCGGFVSIHEKNCRRCR